MPALNQNKIKCQNKKKKVVKKHRVSQFVTSFDSSWLRFRRKLWVWISKKIKINKIGRLRVSNSTFWVLNLETFRSTYVISTLKMQFYEFSLSCHVLKRLLLFTRLSLWRLCSHYLFMSLFPPFLVPPKSVTLGKPEPVRAGESLQVWFYKNI